jgi:hypothetical protein
MLKLAIGVAAAFLISAAVPASAQGLWIGAPGFGIGIGVAPTYAYEPYYNGYGGPYGGPGYAYEPSVAYSTYAYEPEVEYDSYAYAPTYSYGNYSYGPRSRVYAYERSDGYRYAPRYSRSYAYAPEVRTARGGTYADTHVMRRDRHRAAELHNAGLQHRAVMHDRSEIRAEKSSVSSRQIKPEASKHFARGSSQDLRPSKRLDADRVRTRTHGY